MTPQEYLNITQDLRLKLDDDLLPHQEKLHQSILDAEEKYAKRCNTEPAACQKARSALANYDVVQMMISYIYKWAEQDASKQLDIDIAGAELEYARESIPLTASFEKAVEEKILCTVHS